MNDPRIDRLAELVTGYSLGLEPGKLVRVEGSTVAAPYIAAMHRAALKLGANVYTYVTVDAFAELMLEHASDEQLAHVSPTQTREIENVDAVVTIWGETNTRALSNASPERHQRWMSARRELSNLLWDRISAGEATWCGTLAPTQSHAQDAEMSLADYEDFVFGACHVRNGDDPIEHWSGVSRALNARARELEAVRELRILGPDTDLTLGVAGRTWIAADGKYNMPDGEVFTSPVETETEGEIRFTFPALFNGREVEDVRLRFSGGRVVAAEAARGDDYLQSLLEMDEGARVAGEIAFGLNYEIDRFTRNILFDEKIGGTMHLALGSGFPQVGSQNRSGLHWDLICDLRADGEVYADGELIWRAGNFIGEPLPAAIG